MNYQNEINEFNTPGELIDEYNRRMNSNDYPNKDEIRQWYAVQSDIMICQGKGFSFSFLYPDTIKHLTKEEMEKENLLFKERKQYNRDAVEILLKIMKKYPSLRFLQILYNAKVIDKEGDFYNQEPTETFKKLFEYLYPIKK